MSEGHAHDHHHHHHERGALTRRAALASVSTGLFLTLLKLWASVGTGSVAMLGSLADSALDLIASLVTLYAVWLAAQPADYNHRFGHGKAEALAALFQTGLIAASALGIAWRGMTRFGTAGPPQELELGIAVSLIAMALTLALITYQRFVVRKTGSVAIHADHVHYSSDLLLNAAVIAALVLDAALGVRGADPLFGVGIALWLLWHAREIASQAIDQLMDREWPHEKRERFLSVAIAHPELKGIHDIRTRTSGARDFVQVHVWMDPNMTLAAAHDVMDEVEAKLRAEFPGTEVFIHPEPRGHVSGHCGDHGTEATAEREPSQE